MGAMFPWDVLVTGAVGIAGIGGTLWSGKRSINAENDRANKADKRRIYAACQAALVEIWTAAVEYELSRSKLRRRTGAVALGKQRDAMYRTTSEARLIASSEVEALLDVVTRRTLRYITAIDTGDENLDSLSQEIGDLRKRLNDAMRADLDEPR
jgi:hypothetical protein